MITDPEKAWRSSHRGKSCRHSQLYKLSLRRSNDAMTRLVLFWPSMRQPALQQTNSAQRDEDQTRHTYSQQNLGQGYTNAERSDGE